MLNNTKYLNVLSLNRKTTNRLTNTIVFTIYGVYIFFYTVRFRDKKL